MQCATSASVGRPRGTSHSGAGAWACCAPAQVRQTYFGRTVTSTRNCAGIDEDQRTVRGTVRPRRIEPLRPAFANPLHRAAAAGAKDALRFEDLLDPGQMRGKIALVALRRSSWRLPGADHLLGRFAGRRQHPGRSLDIFEWQVMLVRIALLGLRAESIAAHLREQAFQPRARLLDCGKTCFRLDPRGLGGSPRGFGLGQTPFKICHPGRAGAA